VLLMCVAEALLRIPDQETADKLIRDKLGDADWKRHIGQSRLVLVNASTWGLMLTGRWSNLADDTQRNFVGAFQAPGRSRRRTGDPPRGAPGHAHHGPPVRHGAHHRRSAGTRAGDNAGLPLFLRHARRGALTQPDALRYFEAYKAILAIGARGPFDHRVRRAVDLGQALGAAPALRVAKRARVLAELTPACWNWRSSPRRRHRPDHRRRGSRPTRTVAGPDRRGGHRSLAGGWNGFGLAMQAYQKRARS
jgi:RHH-type proline utilization regulon transcriptional repressor/proline dehydrogenase/delta 1-pyrroline-5-carboxylate dehydrogenase